MTGLRFYKGQRIYRGTALAPHGLVWHLMERL